MCRWQQLHAVIAATTVCGRAWTAKVPVLVGTVQIHMVKDRTVQEFTQLPVHADPFRKQCALFKIVYSRHFHVVLTLLRAAHI